MMASPPSAGARSSGGHDTNMIARDLRNALRGLVPLCTRRRARLPACRTGAIGDGRCAPSGQARGNGSIKPNAQNATALPGHRRSPLAGDGFLSNWARDHWRIRRQDSEDDALQPPEAFPGSNRPPRGPFSRSEGSPPDKPISTGTCWRLRSHARTSPAPAAASAGAPLSPPEGTAN